jgi:hypothetical protein
VLPLGTEVVLRGGLEGAPDDGGELPVIGVMLDEPLGFVFGVVP